MRENKVISGIYSRLKQLSDKLYPVVHQSVQEGVANGFHRAMEKAGEKKQNPGAASVNDTNGARK